MMARNMEKASLAYQKGALKKARKLLQEVCLKDPRQLPAWRMLMDVHLEMGELDKALQAYQRLISINPKDSALDHLASWLFKHHAFHKALRYIITALERNRAWMPVLVNVGIGAARLGYYKEAFLAFDQALRYAPNDIDILLNKGFALLTSRRYEEVIANTDSILAIRPAQEEALIQKILALAKLQRFSEIEAVTASFRERTPKTLSNLAAALIKSDALNEALSYIDQAIEADPQYPPAWVNKAAALNRLGFFHESAEICRRLLRKNPLSWQAHINLAIALGGLGHFKDAEETFSRALKLNPHVTDELHMGNVRRSFPPDSFEPQVDGEVLYVHAHVELLKRCQWRQRAPFLKQLEAITRRRLEQGRVPALKPSPTLLSLPLSPRLQREIAASYSRHLVRYVRSLNPPPFKHGSKGSKRRLRIGYISSDFRTHPTAYLIGSMFGYHDKHAFETFCYSLHPGDDSPYFQKIASQCHHFVDLSQHSNIDAARRIYEDGIHILVDLNGYTLYARPEILALRPAPIQVNYLGYPGTMGADFMDYIIGDPVVLDRRQEACFSERIIRLPGCYQVNEPLYDIPEAFDRDSQGLPEDVFVFCCFNASYKIEPVTWHLWMRILKRVPNSVLWLLEKSPAASQHLRDEAERCGVPPERLVFAGPLPRAKHLARQRLADLFLDTLIYNAHTTASDALRVGLPVLTHLGHAFPSRVASSLLTVLGIPELITRTLREYENLAVHLATHRGDLNNIREKLLRNRESYPLFNTEGFVRHLEAAYRAMWEHFRAGM